MLLVAKDYGDGKAMAKAGEGIARNPKPPPQKAHVRAQARRVAPAMSKSRKNATQPAGSPRARKASVYGPEPSVSLKDASICWLCHNPRNGNRYGPDIMLMGIEAG